MLSVWFVGLRLIEDYSHLGQLLPAYWRSCPPLLRIIYGCEDEEAGIPKEENR